MEDERNESFLHSGREIFYKKAVQQEISMAFGNPYGDEWHADIAAKWAARLHNDLGINTLALSDTIGTSNRKSIKDLFSTLIPAFPKVNFGAHLHTTPESWREKVDAAYQAGCRRFDGAIKGYGGCPMAADDLTGNMATENILAYLDDIQVQTKIDRNLFGKAMEISSRVFPG